LEKEGWIRQFIADEAQAKDAEEIYDLLGYEVYLQPLTVTRSKKDRTSPEESQSQCQTVYIRPKKPSEE
jgi:hypothetical protein